MREKVIGDMPHGFPELTGLLLSYFFGALGFDIEKAGVSLLVGGVAVIIFARLAIILADGPALKDMLSCKGHSGTLPCSLCMNAVQHEAPRGGVPLHLFSDKILSIAEPTLASFQPHTNATVHALMMKLSVYKSTLGPTAFGEKETMLGFTWNPCNLMMNTRIMLGLVSVLMYDWAHIFLCEGIVDVEIGLFMKHMHVQRTSTNFDDVAAYISGWRIPSSLPRIDRLFTPSAIKNNLTNSRFSSTASELLTLVPLLIMYMTRVVALRGACMPHVLRPIVGIRKIIAYECFALVLKQVSRMWTDPSINVH